MCTDTTANTHWAKLTLGCLIVDEVRLCNGRLWNGKLCHGRLWDGRLWQNTVNSSTLQSKVWIPNLRFQEVVDFVCVSLDRRRRLEDFRVCFTKRLDDNYFCNIIFKRTSSGCFSVSRLSERFTCSWLPLSFDSRAASYRWFSPILWFEIKENSPLWLSFSLIRSSELERFELMMKFTKSRSSIEPISATFRKTKTSRLPT